MMVLAWRGGGIPGARSLFPGLFSCLLLAAVSASVPVDNCPDHIECARVHRHFCKPGSSHCGPCLASLEEDKEGHCVVPKKHYNHGKKTSLPDLDEEIDNLSSFIAKQQVSDVKKPVSPSWPSLHFQSEERNIQPGLNSVSQSATAKPTTHTASKHTSKSPTPNTDSPGRGKPIAIPFPRDSLLVVLMSACIIIGTAALILAAVCWVRLQNEARLAQKVDYPAFQVSRTGSANNVSVSKTYTGMNKGDKKLAHSAQMYHYQHQKQQMLSMEKNKSEPKVTETGATSDEETEEGDFKVYECPGLAPTGEMEVKNPLFDDSTVRSEKYHK